MSDWKIISATIMDDGDCLEISFINKRDSMQTMTTKLEATMWLKGSWAEFKLAQFQAALSDAIKILEGKR